MLEDDHTDEAYFSEIIGQAIELCAYLCQEYGIPVEKIVSHKEAGEAGYASKHGDPENWFKDMNYSMDDFRREVQKLIEPKIQYEYGDEANTYGDGALSSSETYDFTLSFEVVYDGQGDPEHCAGTLTCKNNTATVVPMS